MGQRDALSYGEVMMDMDPRLVALYDLDNSAGPDHDYFRALTDRLEAHTIVDLGCGTGMLTATLARSDRRVVGIDPDQEMLNFARARPGGADVQWLHGDSRADQFFLGRCLPGLR